MKKSARSILCSLLFLILFSCQNELVKRIEDQLQVDKPVITEEDTDLDKLIMIRSTTPGAKIYYTTDNTEPVPGNPQAVLYSEPILLSGHGESLYIRTRAFKTEMTPSGETVAQFGNVYPSPPPPVLSQSGGIFTSAQSVTIDYPDLTGTRWESDGVTIHYTLDGSSPTVASPVFTPGLTAPVVIDPGTDNYSATVILNAVSIHPDYPASRAASAVYTVAYAEKAALPGISAIDTSPDGGPLNGGVVFGPTDVTVSCPAGTTVHYRTRLDASTWSAWQTSASAASFTILNDGPRDGAVVTVQAYTSRPGYRDSDPAVASFSYLILTVAPPIMVDDGDFANGGIYGRNLELEFVEVADAKVYYTIDGTVPVPGTEGIGGGSTHLYDPDSPVTGQLTWLYGEMDHGQPLFINAVHQIGGRISPVSTYWCNVDKVPPAAPASLICISGHERLYVDYFGLAGDTVDMIVSYNNGLASSQTLTGLSPADVLEFSGLINADTYAVTVEIRDACENERILVNENRTIYSVVNTGDSGPGSLRQALADADGGDTVLFDPGVFNAADGAEIIYPQSTLAITKSLTLDGDAGGDGRNDVIFADSAGFNDAVLTVNQSSDMNFTFRNLSFDSCTSSVSQAGAVSMNISAGSSILFDSCIFTDNQCSRVVEGQAGAVYVHTISGTSYAPAEFQSCVFVGNRSNNTGGAVCAWAKPVEFEECLFIDNFAIDATDGGGAVSVYPVADESVVSLVVNRCTFFNNGSNNDAARGLTVFDNGSFPAVDLSVEINNSIFWDSMDGNGENQLFNGMSAEVVSFNIDHTISNAGVAMNPLFSAPGLTDLSADGIWFNGNDGLQILAASPCNLSESSHGTDIGCYNQSSTNPFVSGGYTKLHVERGGDGDMSGIDWDHSLADPQQAFDLAAWYGIGEVWIQGYEGVGGDPPPGYVPQTRPNGGNAADPRTCHFALRDGVSVYGGFAGTETLKTERIQQDLNMDGDVDGWEYPYMTLFTGDIDGVNFCQHVFYHNQATDYQTTSLNNCGIAFGLAPDTGLAGGGISQIFGASMTLNGCFFIENLTACTGSPNGGGAIYQEGGILDINNSFFLENEATGAFSDAGAIMVLDSIVNVTETEFIDNDSSDNGGAFYIRGSTVTFDNCLFDGNDAASGGAVYLTGQSSLTATDCIFNASAATTSGGAFAVEDSNLTLTRTHFRRNESPLGAGIALLDDSSFGPELRISGCVFDRNGQSGTSTIRGGGIYLNDILNSYDVLIGRSIFYNNRVANADGIGAAVFCNALSGVSVSITKSTFLDNTRNSGAPEPNVMYCGDQTQLSISDSIFWDTGTQSGVTLQGGNAPMNIRNSIFDTDGCQLTVTHCFNENPLFPDPFTPEGEDGQWDILEIAAEPYVSGDDEIVPGIYSWANDARRDAGGSWQYFDIGCYEIETPNPLMDGRPLYVVDSGSMPTVQNNGGSWATAIKEDIQFAIDKAYRFGIDEVWVEGSTGGGATYSPVAFPNGSKAGISRNNGNPYFAMRSGVTLIGGLPINAASISQQDPDTYQSVLDGNSNKRIFYHEAEDNITDTVILNGFDFTNGTYLVSEEGQGGGAIFNDGVDMIVRNSQFYTNNANHNGGAIMHLGGSLRIENSSLSGNTADGSDDPSNGGGALCAIDANVLILESEIIGNSAIAQGGGLLLIGGSTRILNSRISFNNSENKGGGVFSESYGSDTNELIIVNSLISGNADSGTEGQAFHLLNADFLCVNSTIADNGNMNNQPAIFYQSQSGLATSFQMYNCIVRNQGDSVFIPAGVTNPAIIDYSFFNRQGDFVGICTGNVSTQNPDLNPGTYELTAGSNALDTGNKDLINESILNVDLNGNGNKTDIWDVFPDLNGELRIKGTDLDPGCFEY